MNKTDAYAMKGGPRFVRYLSLMFYHLFTSLSPAKYLKPRSINPKVEFSCKEKQPITKTKQLIQKKKMHVYRRARGSPFDLDGPVATLLFLGADI